MDHHLDDRYAMMSSDDEQDMNESAKICSPKPSQVVRLVSADRKTRQKRGAFPRYKENVQGRTYVDHTYIDHLHDAPDIPSTISLTDIAAKNMAKGPRGGVSVAFPLKLHQMLTTVAEEGLDHIVSWQPHGRCFLVHNKKRFVEEIMVAHFNQNKLTSFQRQLNLYGFARITAGRDRGSYYHPLFLRQREFLCERMTRTRIKGNGMKAVPSPSTEPDFYKMPYCPPLFSTSHADDAIKSLNLKSSTTTGTSLASLFRYQPRASIVSASTSSLDPPSPVSSNHKLVIDGQVDFTSSIRHCLDVAVPSFTTTANSLLHNGDLAFFEGQQFRYLELSDDEEESFMKNDTAVAITYLEEV
ncbi:hypothetical protein MPSEU_000398500 [Mayamaea pseudoterrestris]|nr:hypothetical protein MPSEU_000398500 [Mayamaea pseudoterrestris]